MTAERLLAALRSLGLFPGGVVMAATDTPFNAPMPLENVAGLLAAALNEDGTDADEHAELDRQATALRLRLLEIDTRRIALARRLRDGR